MSEALNKFIIGKAKTRATFEKKFSGQDGALSLMEMVGDAPKGVQKQAQKIFQANADDVEKAVSEIANLAYGSGAPAKKTGIQGKTNAKPEVIEGNLPTNDTGVVADPPKAKKKGKPTAEEQSLDTARQSQAFQGEREAAMAAASEPRGQRKAAAKKELEEAQADPEGDDGELDSSIGQFVPADGLGGVEVAGSFLPGAFDPRIQLELGGAAPTFSVDTDPASLKRANPMDMSLLGGANGAFDASAGTGAPAPIEPKVDPSAPVPFDLSSLDMDWMTPRADISKLDLSALFGDGTASPLPSSQTPPSPEAMDMSLLAGGGPGSGGPMDMSRMANPEFQYSAPAETPVAKRPPFYDPNRTMSQWWNEPGPVSRANEFLYQRGMSPGIARAVQPTASVIDKSMKVLGPAAVGLGAGYGALQGMSAIANMGQESPAVAPPTDEEQAALEAKADESMRQLQQILGGTTLRNPASAPPAAPVK